jgi:hypothetical protein
MPPNGLLVRILQIPNTWNRSVLQTLKQLHDNLLTHYNCTEWAPPLADDAPAPGAPAHGHADDSDRPLSLPPINLLASLRVRQDEDDGEVADRLSLPPQRQVTKHIMQTWMLHEHMLRDPPMDRVHDVHMHTCFITPNQCPCLMRPLPCMAICRNATTRRAASSHVSLSPLKRQCGVRWAVHGRQAAEMRRAPRSQSRRRTMLPSSISSSGSPTTLPSLLLRT